MDGKPLEHFWSKCVGSGRANLGLRTRWLQHLGLAVRECGFKYVRFHGLFHDDMFVYRRKGSLDLYNWQYVDDLFDRLLDIGIRPFVELGFCPKDLATRKGTVFWWKGHGSPPRSYSRWAGLVKRFAEHCVRRYGVSEVRNWFFEVWNEPNLQPFFHGTRSQYFELYKTTSLALKGVDKDLRVGGPTTSNFVPDSRFEGETENVSEQLTLQLENLDELAWKPVWVEEFLKYCKKNNLPVDFVSTHPYPTDYALDTSGNYQGRSRSADSTVQDLRLLKEIVRASPYPDAEIHLTEWNSSPSARDHTHDYPQAATFVVKSNLESIGLADSLSYWTFSDVFEEDGPGESVFHGGFGLLNYQGLAKPSFHAYRFLNLLGDVLLYQQNGVVATRMTRDDRLALLIYHYPPEISQAVSMSIGSRERAEAELRTGKPAELQLTLAQLRPGSPFVVETLDEGHGFALREWQRIGSPEPPSREQVTYLNDSAMATDKHVLLADERGTLTLNKNLKPWTVLSVWQLR